MTRKVLIIDSGMRNLGGHNFSYTRAVQAALERRGVGSTVFANKNLPGELAKAYGYHPVFSLGAYDFPPGNGPLRDLKHLYAQSIIYCDELDQAFRSVSVEDYDIVFCHTVNDFELMGWNRYLSRRKLPGRLMILLRNTPGFKSCPPWKRLAHPYWRIKPRYLNAIRAKQGKRFVLLTDSEPLSEDYARIYSHRIVTMPIPINGYFSSVNGGDVDSPNSISTRYGLGRDRSIRIGYMGDARPSKGFLLLPELVKRILSETSIKTRFIIQCPSSASGYESRNLPDGVAELQKVARDAGSRLVLISEKLSERDYADLFHCLDVVLVPYLSANYAEATSGIFAEALALSKPVVIPSGTWMARELSKSGGGIEFKAGDVDDLAAKVTLLTRQHETYALKARQFSSAWKSFHNPQTLVDILLEEGGVAPTFPVPQAGKFQMDY